MSYVVPVYDCRNGRGFKLASLEEQNLPVYRGEIFENSIVFIVFTVGYYEPHPDRRPDSSIDFRFTLSLNIKYVVLLGDPEREYTATDLPGDEPWGITMKNMEEEEVEAGDEEF